MEGGAWQRLLYFGVMKIHPALHAAAKSGWFALMARWSGDFLLSPRGGCHDGLEAIFPWAVYATAGSDGDGWTLPRCVIGAIRTGLCRNLDGVAVRKSGVSRKIARFA